MSDKEKIIEEAKKLDDVKDARYIRIIGLILKEHNKKAKDNVAVACCEG